MGLIRVLVADDDPTVLSAMADVLSQDPRFDVVGTATTGGEAVRLAGEVLPDVILLDVRMPDGGPRAVEALGVNGGAPAVVAISAHHQTPAVQEMIRAGVVGYLSKGRVGGALPDLLARCARGEVILAAPTAARAFHALLRP